QNMAVFLLLSAVLGLLSIFWLVLGFRKRQPHEPPLEMGWIPYLGCALQFSKNPLTFLQRRKAKYGEIFTCKITNNYYHFIADPLSYGNVSRHGKYLDWKKFQFATSTKVFGHGNMDPKFGNTSENLHDTFVKMLQGEPLGHMTENMMENLQYVMLGSRNASKQAKFDWTSEGLYSFCYEKMFEAGYMTLFGKDLKDHEENNYSKLEAHRFLILNALKDFQRLDKVFPALVAGFSIHLFRNAYKSREALAEGLCHSVLQKWQKLSPLITLRILLNDTLSNFDEMEKGRTHVAILWASHANTLPATFWALFYILRCPKAKQAIQKEIKMMLQKTKQKVGQQQSVIKQDDFGLMPILDSAVKEALRLSSASLNIRAVKEDFRFVMDSGRSYAIRKDDYIVLYPPLLHFDPEIYENPMDYQYDRFLDSAGQEKKVFYKNGRMLKCYFLPFGSGMAKCPGRHLAMNEIKQFLVLMLCYYDIELLEPNGAIPPLDQSRAGLGVLPPTFDIKFRYKRKRL
uniref:Uncharacterized protein n=1 Tax=Latimeria chalumnae TaxID=7897 RepID=H3B3T3_LATCH